VTLASSLPTVVASFYARKAELYTGLKIIDRSSVARSRFPCLGVVDLGRRRVFLSNRSNDFRALSWKDFKAVVNRKLTRLDAFRGCASLRLRRGYRRADIARSFVTGTAWIRSPMGYSSAPA